MSKSWTLKELAEVVNGQTAGDENKKIKAFNGIERAGENEITYITKAKMREQLLECRAGAALVPLDMAEIAMPVIRVADPESASAILHNFLVQQPFTAKGVSPEAHIGEDCRIPEEISIHPLVCVGDRARLGERVVLHPGVVLGDDVEIGDDTVLHANVTVADGSIIGERVIIHSGTVIGSDGFGYSMDRATGRHIKRPQVGIVRIEDDVEIGANCCVDRAAFGVTLIKRGVKIDNLVQVAHNVEVGEDCILVAQSGIAGSTTLGRHVMIGGGASIAGHLSLEDEVMVAGRGGVHNSQKKGAVVGGYPAFDARKWAKASAAYPKLPEVIKEMRRLRKQMESLAAGLKTESGEE